MKFAHGHKLLASVSLTLSLFVTASAQEAPKRDYDRSIEVNMNVEDGLSYYDLQAYEAAVPVWRELAEAGHPGSQFELGAAYSNGFGTEYSLEKAAFWLRKAARQDMIEAQKGMITLHKISDGSIVTDEERDLWVRHMESGSASHLENFARATAFSE
ncbi:MAG: sel1 repeat family protein [Hellea sp.]|nr:sel1 repeat family protein [Hellea sp.]